MFLSVLPILLLITFGAVVRRWQWFSPHFFTVMESFTYRVAFPALLFVGVVKLHVNAELAKELVISTWVPTLLVLVLVWVGVLVFKVHPLSSRSSVVQGAVRPNSYFGLAVASLMLDANTAALVMLALSLILPLVNIVAIVALAWWGEAPVNTRTVLKALFTNPIILSTSAGFLVSAMGWQLPGFASTTLSMLGQCALALGLLCVGGGLVFSVQGLRLGALAGASTLKLLLMPWLAIHICAWWGVTGAVATAACFYCALPTAPNAYIMARQMGGDAPLMASLITVQTFLAVFTMPLVQLWMT